MVRLFADLAARVRTSWANVRFTPWWYRGRRREHRIHFVPNASQWMYRTALPCIIL